jgi:hypothetical protein
MRNMARWRRLKTFAYSAMYIGREYRQLNLRDKRWGHEKHGQVEEAEDISVLCYVHRKGVPPAPLT